MVSHGRGVPYRVLAIPSGVRLVLLRKEINIMASLTQNVVVGTASANSAHAADLGKTVFADGKYYKLVKASATIATAASRGLQVAFTAGVPTWSVAIPSFTTANDIVFVPAGQVGSTNTTSLISGDYFLAQVSGPGTGIAADTAATLAIGTAVSLVQPLFVNTLGQLAAYTPLFSLAVVMGNIRSTNTAVASVASAPITIMIGGLV